MTSNAVGIWLHYKADLAASVLADSAIAAIASTSWARPLKYLRLQGTPIPRRPGVLKLGEREAVVRAMVAHESVWEVDLLSMKEPSDGFGEFCVETSRITMHPPTIYGRQWFDMKRVDLVDEWVAVMLELAGRVGASHGVVPVMADDAVCMETSLAGIRIDGVYAHPDPAEFCRMQNHQRRLGTEYVRFPRWGTLYSRAHVRAMGGLERIRSVVDPAVVREIGDAQYFQLSQSVATAMSAEVVAKQRAFTELAEPLLPPTV